MLQNRPWRSRGRRLDHLVSFVLPVHRILPARRVRRHIRKLDGPSELIGGRHEVLPPFAFCEVIRSFIGEPPQRFRQRGVLPQLSYRWRKSVGRIDGPHRREECVAFELKVQHGPREFVHAMPVFGPWNRRFHQRLPRLGAKTRVNRRYTGHEPRNAGHRCARGNSAEAGRIGPEGRQMRHQSTHAVQLISFSGLRLPVEEGQSSRVVGHVELDGGLCNRSGHRGIHRIATGLHHVEHGLRDDRMLTAGHGLHSADHFLCALVGQVIAGQPCRLGALRGASHCFDRRSSERRIAKELSSIHDFSFVRTAPLRSRLGNAF